MIGHKQNAGEEVSEPTIEPRKTVLKHKLLNTILYDKDSFSQFLFKSVIILAHVFRIKSSPSY
jgi:hypothetical protein